MDNSKIQLDSKMTKLVREKKTAREFQERRHEDWNDNYELYRNKVRTNRLTQRQAVNIPLMKETIKTALSKIDDAPNVDWKERSGDEYKEIIFQEMWDKQAKNKKFEWLDIIDKKNVMLYGLSTKKLNISDDGVTVDVLDVYDVVFDPLMIVNDIETARFIVHQNIFKSLREILADDRYTKEGRDALKMWAMTDYGMVQSNENKEEYEKKLDRIKAMGVSSDEFPNFAGGDVVVNLTEHYTKVWNTKEEKFEKRVVVYANDQHELLDEKLEDLIGIDLYPFSMWQEDPDTTDIYADSIADLVRTPNKIINVYFSQLVENRTLQNFQMHWYDASKQGYKPQTYEPGPGKMLPAPGNPRDTIFPVEINGLDETLTAIDFITKIVERGTGAVAIDKGVREGSAQTLGEVEILVGKSMERSIAMQKFYRSSWEELATKWEMMIQANPPSSITLYKTGRSGKLYKKVVVPKDWKSEAGYEPTVSSTSEQESNKVQTIQKFQAILQQFPNNVALRQIAQKRQLELLDFTPAELKEVMEEEERQQEQVAQQTAQQSVQATQPIQPQATPTLNQPQEDEQLLSEIDQSLSQLA